MKPHLIPTGFSLPQPALLVKIPSTQIPSWEQVDAFKDLIGWVIVWQNLNCYLLNHHQTNFRAKNNHVRKWLSNISFRRELHANHSNKQELSTIPTRTVVVQENVFRFHIPGRINSSWVSTFEMAEVWFNVMLMQKHTDLYNIDFWCRWIKPQQTSAA